MTDRDYSEVLFPRTRAVCGWRLRTFTLGHALLLVRMGSPLPPMPAVDRLPNAADVALGVWACGRTWRAALAALGGWRASQTVRFIAWTLSGSAWDVAQNDWLVYSAESVRRPNVWVKEKAPRCAAPVSASLHARLVTEFGMSIDDALDVPVALALHMTAADSEMNGASQFVSEHEEAVKRRAKEAASKCRTGEPHGR